MTCWFIDRLLSKLKNMQKKLVYSFIHFVLQGKSKKGLFQLTPENPIYE